MQSDFSGLTSGMYSVQPHVMPTASAFSLQGARDSRYWSQYLDPRFSGISNLSMSVPPFGMNDVPCDSSSSSPLSSKTLAEDVKETSGIKPSPDKM